jgi:hypothetical protein
VVQRHRGALPSLGVVARVVRCSRKGHLALIEGTAHHLRPYLSKGAYPLLSSALTALPQGLNSLLQRQILFSPRAWPALPRTWPALPRTWPAFLKVILPWQTLAALLQSLMGFYLVKKSCGIWFVWDSAYYRISVGFCLFEILRNKDVGLFLFVWDSA